MSDEIHEIGEVEVISNTMTEEVTIVGSESAIDWENLPENESAPPVAEPEVTYPVARGSWDFTDTQRIVLALLIWLNLMILGLGYLAITGRI